MDFPMMSSPTRFITASIRAASTRSELSETVVTAEELLPWFAGAGPGVSPAREEIWAAWASRRSPRSSCSDDSACSAASILTSETTAGILQRWEMCSMGCLLEIEASTISTEAAARLSSGRREMTVPQVWSTLRINWKAAARMELLGSTRRAMLKTLSPRGRASDIISRSYSLQSKRAGMDPTADLDEGWAPWED